MGGIGFGKGTLILDHVLRFGALGFGFGFDGVEFEVGEDRLGAFDDGFREACQAGDLDAVALVGGTGEDLVEEDNFLVPLSNGDVVVGDAGLKVDLFAKT